MATASAWETNPSSNPKDASPKAADQPYRFVAFGDCGADTPEQRQIALRTFNLKPDFVMITGDIVYGKGLISEYRSKYWPVYNADIASAAVGAAA